MTMVAHGRYACETATAITGNPFVDGDGAMNSFATQAIDGGDEDSNYFVKENDTSRNELNEGKERRGPLARIRRGIDNRKGKIRRHKSGGSQDDEQEIPVATLEEEALAPVLVSPINKPNTKPNNAHLSGAFREGVILSQAGADIGMAAAEAEAEANGWDVTICICDPNGIPIQVKRNTSIGAVSYDMAVEKAKSAATFGKPTGAGAMSNNNGTKEEAAALVSVYPFMHMAGGVPLILHGKCCGAVGVSSGMISLEQDEAVAMAAIKALADIYWATKVMDEQAIPLNSIP